MHRRHRPGNDVKVQQWTGNSDKHTTVPIGTKGIPFERVTCQLMAPSRLRSLGLFDITGPQHTRFRNRTTRGSLLYNDRDPQTTPPFWHNRTPPSAFSASSSASTSSHYYPTLDSQIYSFLLRHEAVIQLSIIAFTTSSSSSPSSTLHSTSTNNPRLQPFILCHHQRSLSTSSTHGGTGGWHIKGQMMEFGGEKRIERYCVISPFSSWANTGAVTFLPDT